jgi:hypothetical protein
MTETPGVIESIAMKKRDEKVKETCQRFLTEMTEKSPTEIIQGNTELLISDHTAFEPSILEDIKKTQSINETQNLASCIKNASQFVSIVIQDGINDCILIGEPHQGHVKPYGILKGKTKPFFRFLEWKNSVWDITFQLPTGKERCFVILNNPDSFQILIHDTKNYKWDLEPDPIHWRFNTDILVNNSIEKPNINKDHMIHEIGCWCRRELAGQSSHYPSIYLWLRFYEANDSEAKTALRELLHSTSLVLSRPFADSSLARQEFAKAIYPYSPLAQRTEGEYHLWFCMEYSVMLQRQSKFFKELNKTGKRELNKTSQRNQNTQAIRAIKQSLNRTSKQALENWYVPDDSPTLEKLEKQGEDWRLYIKDLVLWDVVRKYWDEPEHNKFLKQACMKYVNTLSSINGYIGHNPCYGTLVL